MFGDRRGGDIVDGDIRICRRDRCDIRDVVHWLVGFLLDEASQGPELWHQRGYLARVVSAKADTGLRDMGVLPLTTFLDDPEQDGIALTMEMDGTGSVYPMLYVRRGGAVAEHTLPDSDLAEYTSSEHRRAAVSALAPIAA